MEFHQRFMIFQKVIAGLQLAPGVHGQNIAVLGIWYVQSFNNHGIFLLSCIRRRFGPDDFDLTNGISARIAVPTRGILNIVRR
jgi:hypothetical protein